MGKLRKDFTVYIVKEDYQGFRYLPEKMKIQSNPFQTGIEQEAGLQVEVMGTMKDYVYIKIGLDYYFIHTQLDTLLTEWTINSEEDFFEKIEVYFDNKLVDLNTLNEIGIPLYLVPENGELKIKLYPNHPIESVDINITFATVQLDNLQSYKDIILEWNEDGTIWVIIYSSQSLMIGTYRFYMGIKGDETQSPDEALEITVYSYINDVELYPKDEYLETYSFVYADPNGIHCIADNSNTYFDSTVTALGKFGFGILPTYYLVKDNNDPAKTYICKSTDFIFKSEIGFEEMCDYARKKSIPKSLFNEDAVEHVYFIRDVSKQSHTALLLVDKNGHGLHLCYYGVAGNSNWFDAIGINPASTPLTCTILSREQINEFMDNGAIDNQIGSDGTENISYPWYDDMLDFGAYFSKSDKSDIVRNCLTLFQTACTVGFDYGVANLNCNDIAYYAMFWEYPPAIEMYPSATFYRLWNEYKDKGVKYIQTGAYNNDAGWPASNWTVISSGAGGGHSFLTNDTFSSVLV